MFTITSKIRFIVFICLCFILGVIDAKFKWYQKEFELNDDHWIDLRHDNYSSFAVKSDVLSKTYLSFARRNLTFEFPYYGEKITGVSVTTQGFITMSGASNSIPQHAPYVSPLMANFAPRQHPETNLKDKPSQDIRIHRDSKMFIVQWSSMLLVKPESPDNLEGFFTFQAQLHKNGVIRFVYKEIPMNVADITEQTHAVRAGITGGYRSNNEYEVFDTIDLNKTRIQSGSTYTLVPQPSCLDETSCRGCRSRSAECRWCPSLQRCSSGNDYLTPLWNDNSCKLLARSPCEEDLPVLPDFTVPSNSSATKPNCENGTESVDVEKKDKNHRDDDTDIIVIKALLISTFVIVLFLMVATILVKRYGWRSTAFMSHVKFDSKGRDFNKEVEHTLIKMEESPSP